MEKAHLSNRQEEGLPKAILFDWDNTLVDSWRTTYHVFNKILDYYGRPLLTERQFFKRPQISVKDSFPHTFGDNWREVQRIYYKLYEEVHLKFLLPLPGARDLLAHLKRNNVYMALVSNKNGNFLRKEVEFLNWKDYFGAIVGSSDAESDKPSSLPVKLALGSIEGISSKDVLFVDDSMIDIQCARNSGCTPVIVGGLRPIEDQSQDLKKFPDCSAFGKYLGLAQK
jgi:phosphoglycolate phosphatase